MKWILSLRNVQPQDRPRVGGKCFALARLAQAGFHVPETFCIPVEAYETYLESTGLRERILIELHRKDVKEMRWEEVWDSSLRIRNMFLRGPDLGAFFPELELFLESRFKWKPMVIRSSSPDEDSKETSFAGLHESYVNIRGTRSVLKHIKLVWASLWSDAALLYRKELGLDAGRSAMAVVLQEVVLGERSGLVFSQSPMRPHEALLESVHGLNQRLVSGKVEPDRWQLDLKTKKIVAQAPMRRDHYVVPGKQGVRTDRLPEQIAESPPLKSKEVDRLFNLAVRAEKLFGGPQCVDWTMAGDTLWILRSRPTAILSRNGPEDKRQWYLTLRRGFENLKELRSRIEGELVPAMIVDAAVFAGVDLGSLLDQQLAQEIRRRAGAMNRWVTIYWDEFIPFAHGMRLLGQVYNDTVQPEDPYEFVELMATSAMESINRNRLLEKMATLVRGDGSLHQKLLNREILASGEDFLRLLHQFVKEFGDLSCPVTGVVQGDREPEAVVRLVLEMASHPPGPAGFPKKDRGVLREQFLGCFEGEAREDAAELIDLARAGYRMRNDDNIYLARIEAQKLAAVNEAKRRIAESGTLNVEPAVRDEALRIIAESRIDSGSRPPRGPHGKVGAFTVKPRQLLGQPAGQGSSKGLARVILSPDDLGAFRHGEILVCDAVDPNMTFVVPLARGIVERRGGMLIHGAIIAREYGIPCVTGVSDATRWIHTGDCITVDGYLGIVTLEFGVTS